MNKNKKLNTINAFTLVEIMLLLVVFSLVLAASYSVITRKHKLKPSRYVHGQYICFANPDRDEARNNINRRNYEILYSGSTLIRQGFIESTTENPDADCIFDIPSASTYIHVRMIGGGGAGGNSNYRPYIKPIALDYMDYDKQVENISFVASYPNNRTSKSITPLISREFSSSRNAVEYSSDTIPTADFAKTPYLGVTEQYVNGKFRNRTISRDTIFQASLFKFIVNNFVKGVFAYDYAGSGESGGNFHVNSIDMDTWKCEGGALSDVDCMHKYLEAKNIAANPNNSCVAAELKGSKAVTLAEMQSHCPYAFYEGNYIQPQIEEDSPRICGGTKGGRGSVFATDVKPWNFETYPVVGWRWPNYNRKRKVSEDGDPVEVYERDYGLSFYMSSYPSIYDYPSLFNWFRGRSDANQIVKDWVSFGRFSTNNAYPMPNAASVHPGVLSTCTSGTNCINFGSTKRFKDTVYKSKFNSIYSAAIPTFSSPASFDPTSLDFPVEGTDTTKQIYIPRATGPLLAGGYPYFLNNYNLSGVKLMPYQKYNDAPQKKFDNGYVTGSDAPGGAGKDFPSTNANTLLRSMWKDDGKFESCPSDAAMGLSPGEDGKSKFDDNKVFRCEAGAGCGGTTSELVMCLPNMALVFHRNTADFVQPHFNSLNQLMFMIGSLGGNPFNGTLLSSQAAYLNSPFACSNVKQDDYMIKEIASLPESYFALKIMLFYFAKHMTYGESGKNGDYKDFFTRTAESNKIYIRPGVGGVRHEPLADDSIDVYLPPGDEQNGSDTLMYYNCHVDQNNPAIKTNCMSESVAGGMGGKSGVSDTSIALPYTNEQIQTLVTRGFTSGSDTVRYSTNAPVELCDGIGQSGCDGSFRSEDTKFQFIAPLLNLPAIGGFNLSHLGKGGDGSYTRDNCWIVPQYFVIRNASYINSNKFQRYGFGSNTFWNNIREYKSQGNDDLMTKMNEDMVTASITPGLDYYTYPAVMQNQTKAASSLGAAAYTTIFPWNVDTCREGFGSAENSVENGEGQSGNPGAVIITW